MKYLLMIYGNEAAAQAASKADLDQMHNAYMAYTEALKKAGILVGGERLQRSSAATTVRVADGKTAGARRALCGDQGTTRRLLHDRGA